MSQEDYKFDTLKVRAGYDPAEHNGAVSVPIYQTVAFDLGDTARADRLFTYSEAGWLYTRVNNPTVDALERRVAALDGAVAGLALASGMAAISYTLLNLAEGGGTILTSPYLYGGSTDSFKEVYPPLGIHIVGTKSIENPSALEKEITPETRGIFVESISNPNGFVPDFEALAEVAHRNNIPLVVDNTFATPYLLNPLQHGADIVIYSATKALNGHGNVIAGLILDGGTFPWDNGRFPQFTEGIYTLRDENGRYRSYQEAFPAAPFVNRARLKYLNYFGAALGPFDAYLVLQGIETLSERVKKQVENTEKVLRYLEQNEHVSWVRHPYAVGNPNKAAVDKYLPRGAGSVLSFGFKGTIEQSEKFIDATRLFSYHVNVGDARSLIANPPKSTHSELTPEEKRFADIPAETIRLSLGLEDADDLIDDLEQAFSHAE